MTKPLVDRIAIVALLCLSTQFVSSPVHGENTSDAQLLRIAIRRFNQFRPSAAERNLFNAICHGKLDDCTTLKPTDRVIRGELIAWLCTDSYASKQVTYLGVSVAGAKITGDVNLESAKILFPVQFRNCDFEDGLILQHCIMFSLDLTESVVEHGMDLTGATINGDLICVGCQFSDGHDPPAIAANGAHITGFVRFRKSDRRDFEAKGGIELANAKIDRDLECDGAHFIGDSDNGTPALNAENVEVDGSIFLCDKFSAIGEVRLIGARIVGTLNCFGASFLSTSSKVAAISAASVKVGGPVWLTKGEDSDCSFLATGGVDFADATVGGNFDCSGSGFVSDATRAALNANGSTINGDVALANGFVAKGGVSLRRAKIGGSLNCTRGRFISVGNLAALSANGADIKGGVYLRRDEGAAEGFKAEGPVDFTHATVGDDLDCSGGQFLSDSPSLKRAEIGESFNYTPERLISVSGLAALTANGADIKGSVYLRNQGAAERFRAEGPVDFTHATVGGDLNCSGGEFLSASAGRAFDAPFIKIKRNALLCDGMRTISLVNFKYADVGGVFGWTDVQSPSKATLCLDYAKVATLFSDQKYFSNYASVSQDGFAFDQFSVSKLPTASANVNLAWLRLQPRGIFSAQSFEQLAGVLRKAGFQEEAIEVMIAKNSEIGRLAIAHDRERLHKSENIWDESIAWIQKCGDHFWYKVVGPFFGFWYRPINAIWVSFIVIGIGAALFHFGYRGQVIIPTSDSAYRIGGRGRQRLKDTYPKFNSLVYSLETFVPLVKLALKEYWIPSASRGRKIGFPRFTFMQTGGLLRCYLWIHILLGWVLTTLWVAGFTGLLKS